MLLSVDNVSKTYQRNGQSVRALEDVTCQLDSGQFVAVCGPSGCGKSTLLFICGGLMRPESGNVVLEDSNLYGLSPDGRATCRAMSIGFVFQQFHLVPYLNVKDNIMAASLAIASQPSASHQDVQRRTDQLLEHFGLVDRAEHVPSQLSTGERQRVALARALLNRPKLLLADEPTGNLDVENSDIVMNHLREFVTEGGSVLLVTHDRSAAERSDRVLRIDHGRIVSPAVAGEVS